MATKVRVLLSLAAAVIAMSLSGCGHYTCGTTFGNGTCTSSGGGGISQGGGGGTGTVDAYAFIANNGAIEELTLDATGGTLLDTPNYTSPIVPTVPTGWIAVAQKKYVYATYLSVGQIYGWTLGADGSLTAINGSPFSAPFLSTGFSSPQTLITNPAGTLLFVPNVFPNSVYVYQIGSNGGLTLASGSPVTLPFEPQNLAVDGLGKYLYIGDYVNGFSSDQIAAYSIAGTGALTPVPGSPFISPAGTLEFSMFQMAGESSGKYMIGTTSSFYTPDNHLYVFNIQQTGSNAGALTPATGSPFVTTYSPYSIAVQPNSGGDLLYSFSASTTGPDNPVEGFQLNTSNGALTAIAGSPFQATGFLGQFDQSGQFLFVEDGSTSTMAVYNVGASSALTTPVATVSWNQGSWTVSDPQ